MSAFKDSYIDATALLALAIALVNYDLNTEMTTNWSLEKQLDKQTKVMLDRLESKLDKILENQANGGSL